MRKQNEAPASPVRSGNETIQAAIDLAIRKGVHTVTIPCTDPETGTDVWEICAPILLPSDINQL